MIKLFQLKPLGEFFFGGEATFGPGDNRHYFVRSNLLPQQTSLLGLLRHELLKSDPSVFDLVADRIINPAAAAKLVGSQGFDGITDAPFGIIEGLSPIFLLDQNGTPFFLQARLALKQRERTWLEKKSSAEPRFRSESLLATASAKTTGYQLMTEKLKKGGLVAESYDGKAEFQEMLVGADGRQVSLRYDPDEAPEGVFIKIEKTGNRKDYEGASDESGFFKQHMFKLRSGWRFAFFAAFNAALPPDFGTEHKTHFGAERRPFLLHVGDPNQILAKRGGGYPDGALAEPAFAENTFQHFENLYGGLGSAPPGLRQIVLLSDAKVTADIYRHTDFALTEATPFRHFQPSMDSPNTLWRSGNDPKSARYNLLRRSSSLYAQDTQIMENQLLDARAFRRIGYNYFKIITQ